MNNDIAINRKYQINCLLKILLELTLTRRFEKNTVNSIHIQHKTNAIKTKIIAII